jgi:hypothetical protein
MADVLDRLTDLAVSDHAATIRAATSSSGAMTARELATALDEHEDLVVRCVRGELTFDEFERAYAGFYQRWALDGHEGNTELLARYESRIALHRRIWEEVETRRTSAENAERHGAMGFVGPDEARRRLAQIAREFGVTTDEEPTD